jgi:phosphogluconate dehydratase
LDRGPLAKLRDGDIVRLDSYTGVLEAKVPEEIWRNRDYATADLTSNEHGTGRELFRLFRSHAAGAEQGAGVC